MTNQQKPFDPSRSIYAPPEVAKYAIKAIERVEKESVRGIRLGIPEIDGYFAPMLPGEVLSVIAQTSNYKSGFLHMLERHAAEQFQREGRRAVIVHISVEELIEPQAYLYLSRETQISAADIANGKIQDWDKLHAAAFHIGTIPIYRIGESLARAEDMPNLYLTNLMRCVKHLYDTELKPKNLEIGLLTWDYLQAFPIDPETAKATHDSQRRLQVRSDFFRVRQTSAVYGCPSAVGIQAKQELKGALGQDMLLPGIYDGEETSSIAQRTDRAISLWLPKNTHSVGSTLNHKGMTFIAEEDTLWLRVLKQRGGYPSGRTWQGKVDYLNNEISIPH